MSELKTFNSERIYWAVEQVERVAGDIDSLHLDDNWFYIKSDVDNAIAELKQNLQDQCISCPVKMQEDDVVAEKDNEIRRLKRALWISRAKAYHYIAELITSFSPEFIRNRRMFTPNNLKQKQMDSLAWAHLMLKIERKCLKKAEQYK